MLASLMLAVLGAVNMMGFVREGRANTGTPRVV